MGSEKGPGYDAFRGSTVFGKRLSNGLTRCYELLVRLHHYCEHQEIILNPTLACDLLVAEKCPGWKGAAILDKHVADRLQYEISPGPHAHFTEGTFKKYGIKRRNKRS